MTPLMALIRERIAETGSITVAEYMGLCLGHPEHGYYLTRDPLGTEGDFITAPEISQMFGEMIGAWMARVWTDQGRPDPFVLAELGPGRGTLMADMLRAASALPGFADAARIWLVETSPVLRARQAATLTRNPVRWAGHIVEVPQEPLFVIANEFFDALPVRQFRRADPGWQERLVGSTHEGLGFVWGPVRAEAALDERFPHTPDGVIVEVCPAGEAIAASIGQRIMRAGGAALIVDYGEWDGAGDTFQAVANHGYANPLADPGASDLTAHVGFRALAGASGLRVSGPVGQGIFLERLGIGVRADRLALGLDEPGRADLSARYRRLTHRDEMGDLFKVMAFSPLQSPLPPGFAS